MQPMDSSSLPNRISKVEGALCFQLRRHETDRFGLSAFPDCRLDPQIKEEKGFSSLHHQPSRLPTHTHTHIHCNIINMPAIAKGKQALLEKKDDDGEFILCNRVAFTRSTWQRLILFHSFLLFSRHCVCPPNAHHPCKEGRIGSSMPRGDAWKRLQGSHCSVQD
jgi:hypothetical protein